MAEASSQLFLPALEDTRQEAANKHVEYACVSALHALHWQNLFVSKRTAEITAEFEKTITERGTEWMCAFYLNLHWSIEDGTIVVNILVSEKDHNWSRTTCVKLCKELQEKIEKCAAKCLPNLTRDLETSGAKWASREDLLGAGIVDSDYSGGTFIVTEQNNVYLRLCERDSNKHVLLVKPTGGGKTNLLTQNLNRRYQRSALVTEATGSGGRADLFCRTSGYRAAMGHRVYYFNPDDLRSHRVNPLEHIRNHSDVRRMGDIIMRSTTLATHRGDQTWEKAESLLLRALIYHALTKKQEGLCNLAYIHDLLFTGNELTEIIGKSQSSIARQIFEGFIKDKNEKFTSLVIQGLATRLSLWSEPRIRALTETTDIDIEELREHLFTWYLAVPADKHELKPLAALIFNVAFELVTNAKCKQGLALFLDELANFGYVPGLPQKLTILRHDSIPVVIAVQDVAQLEFQYGKEWVLFLSQTACKIFSRPNELKTAETISKLLGEKEEIEIVITSSGEFVEQKVNKPLYSVDSILKLPDGQAIVFTPKTGPFIVEMASYQLFSGFEKQYPAPYIPPLEVDDKIVMASTLTTDDEQDSLDMGEVIAANASIRLQEELYTLPGGW